MLDSVSYKHPRKLVNGKRVPFPLFKTSTGVHCCLKRYRASELRELGVGITLYFKLLKYLIYLFLWFTLVSLPSYYIYHSVGSTVEVELNLKHILATFSLGNIG